MINSQNIILIFHKSTTPSSRQWPAWNQQCHTCHTPHTPKPTPTTRAKKSVQHTPHPFPHSPSQSQRKNGITERANVQYILSVVATDTARSMTNPRLLLQKNATPSRGRDRAATWGCFGVAPPHEEQGIPWPPTRRFIPPSCVVGLGFEPRGAESWRPGAGVCAAACAVMLRGALSCLLASSNCGRVPDCWKSWPVMSFENFNHDRKSMMSRFGAVLITFYSI